MRVLAIDPGYDRLGVAVLEMSGGKETVLHSDCVLSDKQQDLPDRLHKNGQHVTNLINQHRPTMVAIETIFFNKNQKTAIGVAQMRGICVYLAKTAGCAVVEYGPQEIKIAVTGYGKSDKQAVRAMVEQLVVGVPKNALDDEYDAIAVGLTALTRHRR